MPSSCVVQTRMHVMLKEQCCVPRPHYSSGFIQANEGRACSFTHVVVADISLPIVLSVRVRTQYELQVSDDGKNSSTTREGTQKTHDGHPMLSISSIIGCWGCFPKKQ